MFITVAIAPLQYSILEGTLLRQREHPVFTMANEGLAWLIWTHQDSVYGQEWFYCIKSPVVSPTVIVTIKNVSIHFQLPLGE